MTPAALCFATHALNLQWRALPYPVQQSLKIFLLDTIAVGIAGARAPYADEVAQSVAAAGQGRASMFGRAARSSPQAAAFVNAYQIHAQEFDCVHEAAVLHPFSATLGAMSAVCSTLPDMTGEEFGAALAAAIDIAVGLGLAARGKLKFFRPATAGIFGATAGVARLRHLTEAQTVDAFGHALAFVSGTMQAHVEGTPSLALQVANAAGQAVLAVDLAASGLPGAHFSIEGPFGYLTLFEYDHDLAPVLASLGTRFPVTELSHKPFPTGRAAHGGIAATQRLMHEHGVTAGRIDAMRYIAPSLIARLVGRPAHAAMSVNYARLCLPYLAARTLLHGTAGLDAFSAPALSDAGVLSLAARITVEVDDNPDVAAFTPARLHADLTDGASIAIDVPALPGSTALPLDATARMQKVERCLAYGGLDLPAAVLAERVDGLDFETDMASLFAMTKQKAELLF
jgi:2-methylcitrate dehydratase PrpD